jgi:hypothetical protein
LPHIKIYIKIKPSQKEEVAMGLSLRERKMITKEIALRYQKANKKQKGRILDEFCQLAGYNRLYASYILRNWGKKIYFKRNNKQIVFIMGETKQIKRNKPRIYDEKVLNALKKVWYICDCICGKRLSPILEEIIPKLEFHKEILLDEKTRGLLFQISPATIDRLLKEEKKESILKSKSKTKPGTLLKCQIPIRTFYEWDDERPGFVEIDLVGHDGGDIRGDYIQSLDLTDIATCWTETQAVKNKAQIWVFEALKDIRKRLPFKILGIDSDNGSEFINAHLLRFCQQEKITFTRTRPYRKNDNCFVEQKNYSIVRRYTGYSRYDTEEELNILNQLYKTLRLYTNFFLPAMKLTSKIRVGSKITKKYDTPKTPFKRVLESSYIPEENKENLKRIYESLNPAELKRKIDKLQKQLYQLTKIKNRFKNIPVEV